MRPKPDVEPVCANCRFLEEYPHAEEPVRLRAWCHIWRLLIPDPEHTGCTMFQAKEVSEEEGTSEGPATE